MHAIHTLDMSRQEWIIERSKGIGGSDAGVILGLNKYRTAFELWLEKTNQVEPIEIDNEAIYWRNEMENVVAKELEKWIDKKVRRSNFMYSHPEHPFIKANVDRFVVGESAVLECKIGGNGSKSRMPKLQMIKRRKMITIKVQHNTFSLFS
ncbi:YqaJ viral recombinase family protein [Heyndrickxia sporothermodurans]